MGSTADNQKIGTSSYPLEGSTDDVRQYLVHQKLGRTALE